MSPNTNLRADSRPTTGAASSAPSAPPSRFSRGQATIAVIECWLLVAFDGSDLIVYGTVESSLLEDTAWGLNATSLGTVGSMALVGMMIGALLAGWIANVLGQRRTILTCATVFSVLTLSAAFSPNAWVFGGLR